ncbi:Peroxiredoxin-like 2C, partial [Galemys pyrenaicus]
NCEDQQTELRGPTDRMDSTDEQQQQREKKQSRGLEGVLHPHTPASRDLSYSGAYASPPRPRRPGSRAGLDPAQLRPGAPPCGSCSRDRPGLALRSPGRRERGTMAAPTLVPVTRQVSGRAALAPAPSGPERGQALAAGVAELPVVDASGRLVPFGELFRERRAVVVFVRHFLCYICKEYVEDLAKIPKSFLQEADVTLIVIGQSSYQHIEPFCRLTGYSHEIYVDPEREIFKRLGMKRGEEIVYSGQSPHIKSNILSGSIQSLWRAVTGPLFDFQGDPAQQGGTLILGPGNNIHFIHRDRNRLDHKPINSVLHLVGVPHVDFTNRHPVLH